jgi:hypothetical protein
MTAVGGLIAESLRVGGVLEGVPLTITKVWRCDVGDVEAGQPRTWTFLDFEVADQDVERLAHALEGARERRCGSYCDFRTDTETFVIFAGRSFRYPRGDDSGRARAADYARSVGVPEAQLDWPE